MGPCSTKSITTNNASPCTPLSWGLAGHSLSWMTLHFGDCCQRVTKDCICSCILFTVLFQRISIFLECDIFFPETIFYATKSFLYLFVAARRSSRLFGGNISWKTYLGSMEADAPQPKGGNQIFLCLLSLAGNRPQRWRVLPCRWSNHGAGCALKGQWPVTEHIFYTWEFRRTFFDIGVLLHSDRISALGKLGAPYSQNCCIWWLHLPKNQRRSALHNITLDPRNDS